MKKTILMCSVLILMGISLFVVLSDDNRGAETNYSNQEKIRDKKQVNQIDVNDAFIDNPKKWSACWDIEDKIRDKEAGYVDEEFENYIVSNVSDSHDYGIQQNGNEVTVTLTCSFSVFYQFSAFSYQESNLEFPGGVFKMTAHYDDDNYFRGLTFN